MKKKKIENLSKEEMKIWSEGFNKGMEYKRALDYQKGYNAGYQQGKRERLNKDKLKQWIKENKDKIKYLPYGIIPRSFFREITLRTENLGMAYDDGRSRVLSDLEAEIDKL